MSEAMKLLPQLSWLRKGTPIPSQTLTAAYIADLAKYDAGAIDQDELDVREWLGGSKRAVVSEEVVSLGRLRQMPGSSVVSHNWSGRVRR